MILDREIYARGEGVYSELFNESNKVKRDMDIINFVSDNELELVERIESNINPDCVYVYFKSL
jgi:hypothetical protein